MVFYPRQAAFSESTRDLDISTENSQYAVRHQQLEQGLETWEKEVIHPSNDGPISYGPTDVPPRSNTATQTVNATGRPFRRRITRACDKCNQLRTKCDGQSPCAHCVEFNLTCNYARECKKRGKASRKDIAAQQEAVDGRLPDRGVVRANDDNSKSATEEEDMREKKRQRRPTNPLLTPQGTTLTSTNTSQTPASRDPRTLPRLDSNGELVEQWATALSPTPSRFPNITIPDSTLSGAMSDRGSIDDYNRSVLHLAVVDGPNILRDDAIGVSSSMLHNNTMTRHGESTHSASSPGSQQGLGPLIGGSPMSAAFLGQFTGSPRWPPLTSPTNVIYPKSQLAPTSQLLRYPVLRPLLSHISAIISITQACDLLELYFDVSSTFMQPQLPYIVGHVFRKQSFVREHNHRICKPALLASMIWIAARTSESNVLPSSPSARDKLCQQLLELTISLLKPLIHTTHDSPSHHEHAVAGGPTLEGLGVALRRRAHEIEHDNIEAAGGVDDVATYMHLATVVSASEYKAAGLRWWNAAWSLARELKLGREAPQNPEQRSTDARGGDADAAVDGTPAPFTVLDQTGHISEEQREERRRIWWLLYMVDRHLALCYNRPLFLLDSECDGLLQPVDEKMWQAGEYYPSEPDSHNKISCFRHRGSLFECTGHSIFGYFLPVMTILGEIVELHQARNHPRLGKCFKDITPWDDQAAEIVQQLETYGRSLKDFEASDGPTNCLRKDLMDPQTPFNVTSQSVQATGTQTPTQALTGPTWQTKTVVAYGTYLMHILHILLHGKWDPISLLDDNDHWVSSRSFHSATGHVVSAAEAIKDILNYDRELNFMPYFFGIHLLQQSFLILLIADKLQGEVKPSMIKACETVVKAHEACVITSNAEHQGNLRKVMRSALQQVRGHAVDDPGEQRSRRREVLSMYRWNGDGTGLAR